MAVLYRCIIAVTIVLALGYAFVPYFQPRWLTEDQLNLLGWDTYGAIIQSPVWFYWAYYSLWLVILFGLFFYVRISRPLYLLFVVIGIVLSGFYGIRVYGPIDLIVGNILLTAEGAVLVIVYFTSISEKFRDAKI